MRSVEGGRSTTAVNYAYTPAIWPPFASAALTLALGVYCVRRRTTPGALPLAVLMFFATLNLLAKGVTVAALVPGAKIAWFKLAESWLVPAVTAGTCFVLEYVQPGRWLTRRNLGFLTLPVLADVFLILFDNSRLVWSSVRIEPDGSMAATAAMGGLILAAYGLGLVLANAAALLWLSIHSPQHRWPAALILFGQIAGRWLFALSIGPVSAPLQVDPVLVGIPLCGAIYAVALFGFRIFDPLPHAHATALAQMCEGMIVLDAQWHLASLNPAAKTILSTKPQRGAALVDLLPGPKDLATRLAQGTFPAEITLTTQSGERTFALELSPLRDFRGPLIGHLLMMRDVTEERRAQAQVLEQQRALATLRERERLGRELHDSASQVLAYVSMQAQAIAKQVKDGDVGTADDQLRRLAEAAQEAHRDVRESIFSLKAGPTGEWSFLDMLTRHVTLFGQQSGIATEIAIQPGLTEEGFAPGAGVQLLRVVQEALTNARKHSGAARVRVSVTREGTENVVVVEDDGVGFDISQQGADRASGHYGLSLMEERMAEIGGHVTIESSPGTGTRIVFRAADGSAGQEET